MKLPSVFKQVNLHGAGFNSHSLMSAKMVPVDDDGDDNDDNYNDSNNNNNK